MRRLWRYKRALMWIAVPLLWIGVCIITVIWPKTTWHFPATCFWCSISQDFETGRSIWSVLWTMPIFSTAVIIFLLGREIKSVRVLTDTATILVGARLLYLGVMRIWFSIMASDYGPIIYCVNVIAEAVTYYCIISSILIFWRYTQKQNREGGEKA